MRVCSKKERGDGDVYLRVGKRAKHPPAAGGTKGPKQGLGILNKGMFWVFRVIIDNWGWR